MANALRQHLRHVRTLLKLKVTARKGCIGESIVYFADNVLIMLIACTTGYLGNYLAPQDIHKLGQAAVGWLVNMALTWVLFFISRSELNILKEEAANTDSKGARQDLHDSTVAWEHILAVAPWIGQLGAINVFQEICNMILAYTQQDAEVGRRFVIFFFTLLIMFTSAWFSSRAWARWTERGADTRSVPVFFVRLVNGSLLSISGKAAHYVVYTIFEGFQGIMGPEAEAQDKFYAYLLGQTSFLMFSYGLLGYVLPKFSLATEEDKISHTVLAYLVVYAWAFSFVDFLWWCFFTYLNSFALYWAFCGFLLLIAICVYCVCKNFYGGPGPWSKAFGNMLCWTIDFGVWWGWCQTLTEIDHDKTAFSVFVVNLVVAAVLLVTAAYAYVLSDHEHMIKHDLERANPVPIIQNLLLSPLLGE